MTYVPLCEPCTIYTENVFQSVSFVHTFRHFHVQKIKECANHKDDGTFISFNMDVHINKEIVLILQDKT